MIHSDVWGPAPIMSLDGYKYYVSFIDDFTKTTWIYFMKNKTEVLSHFQTFLKMIQNEFNCSIKVIRTDNGTEFKNQNFSQILHENDILHETSCVHTPQQNGVSDRKNRQLLEVARSLLFQMNVPKTFWKFAISTACFLINRTPSRLLNYKCPLSVLTSHDPKLNFLKVFGCTAYVWIDSSKRDKLSPRALKSIFVGYDSTKK
ncbi:integrase catalytic domain-containing protein, partial [Klebsiella pneumoniae]|uniref:integrase catalytic domain-containing protein n=1 Tax=Klebsiella pneumoniae TaxID=573 RepID=UPI003A7FC550